MYSYYKVSCEAYCHHDHLRVHIALGGVDDAIEEAFQEVQDGKAWYDLECSPSKGHRTDAFKDPLGEDMDRHGGCEGTPRFQGLGIRN